MSRIGAGLILALVWCAHPARAQGMRDGSAEARAAEMMANQREAFGIERRAQRCAPGIGPDGQILVCAPDDSEFRVAPTSELDPKSDAALDDGELRPPDFSKRCDPKELGCFGMGGAPPPIYLIDLDAIPEPPEGSDADLISKGEKRAR